MKMRKALVTLLAMTLSMGVFVGCGSTDKAEEPAPSKNETTDKEKPAEKEKPAAQEAAADPEDPTQLEAEITWWSFPQFTTIDDTVGKYEENIIAAFNEKYPNIKVNLETIDFGSGPEKITNAIQGGTVCDILFDAPGRIISYAKEGVLVDVNDMFTDELLQDVNNENIINACKAGDDYYMYPISSAPFLMAFNKTMLEEHGLLDMINLEGDRTWTVDEYEALIKALAEKGEKGAVAFCVSQGGDQGPRAYISNLAGTPITNDDLTAYTINSEGGVEAMGKLKEWVDAGYLLNGSALDGTASIEEFHSGRVSHTILTSPGIYNGNKDKVEFEVVNMPFPTPEGVEPELEYLIEGFCIFDNGDDTKVEASKLFIDFVCNDAEWGPKNVAQTGVFPVRQSFGNLYEGDSEMEYFAGLTKYYGTYYNTIDGFAEMRTHWFPMMQAVLAGDKDPAAALNDFVEASNQSIANAQ